jgi:hypothetical protein
MNKKSPVPLLYAFSVSFVLGALLFFPGCELYGKVGGDDANIEGALPYLLQGEWAYIPTTSGAPSDGYVITSTTIEYSYRGARTDMDYKGEIRFVSNYNSNSGLIIIEYTKKPTYAGYNGNDFFAIYYRIHSSNLMRMANTTTLPAYTCPDTATLEEAKAKFTRMTMGKYVDWSVAMPQTRIK